MKFRQRFEVWKEGNEYVAVESNTPLHAFGTTRGEALFNLDRDLHDEYKVLVTHDRSKLSTRLQAVMDYLYSRGYAE